MPNIKPGTVVLFEGGLYALERFEPAELWENAPELYVGRAIIPTSSYTEHDREIGLPGCTLIAEKDWEQPLPDDLAEHHDAIVIDPEPVYIPARAAEDMDVVGQICVSKFADSSSALLELMFGEHGLSDDDHARRQDIKTLIGADISLLW